MHVHTYYVQEIQLSIHLTMNHNTSVLILIMIRLCIQQGLCNLFYYLQTIQSHVHYNVYKHIHTGTQK